MRLDPRILEVLADVQETMQLCERPYTPVRAIRSFLSITQTFTGHDWPEGYEAQLKSVIGFLGGIADSYEHIIGTVDGLEIVVPDYIVVCAMGIRINRLLEEVEP